eukprot:gene8423-11391_t
MSFNVGKKSTIINNNNSKSTSSNNSPKNGDNNIGWRNKKPIRSHSDAHGTMALHEQRLHIVSALIDSWKLKRGVSGVGISQRNEIFAVYCVNVTLQSGTRWIIEKRYKEFRDLRREMIRMKPQVTKWNFPKKNWFFNLSVSAIKSRQDVLNEFLANLLALPIQPMEILIFLQVEAHRNNALSNSIYLNHHYSVDDVQTGEFMNIGRAQSLSAVKSGIEVSGTSINDFVLVKVLGKGSFGTVYLVRPTRPGIGSGIGATARPIKYSSSKSNRVVDSTVFAMKVLKKADVVKRQQVEHTMCERNIMAQIQHPFVLSLRSAFQSHEKLYMVIDFCQGGELFFHLKKLKRFTEGMVRFYCGQISLALAHLHENFIIFRDLKPENILLDRYGNIKLTDFGLSKMVKSFTLGTAESSSATFCGTPEYLSPEMILHRKTGSGYGKEIDWWSLGIVCFELLTGWPPFFDRDFNKMCDKIIYKAIEFPAAKYGITREAEDLIMKLLNRVPSRRISLTSASPCASQSPQRSASSATATSDLPFQQRFGLFKGSTATPTNDRHSVSGRNTTSGRNESSGLENHPFFSDLDWQALLQCQVTPPYVPIIGSDPYDTRNFDKEFTKMAIAEDDARPDAVRGSLTNIILNAFGGSKAVIPSPDNLDCFRGFSFIVPDDLLNNA